jgi:hypothetical protein
MKRILAFLALVTSALVVGGTATASARASATPSAAASAVRTHTPAGPLLHSTSSHWSGYAAQAPFLSSFNSVSATWTQPSVACGAQNSYVALWVGLDGYNDRSVEQIGTEGDCVRGTPTYYAWFEMYPRPAFNIGSIGVAPGDSVTATVTSQFLAGFVLTIKNNTTGATFSTTQYGFAQRSSAEAIVEAPSTLRRSVLPLANFGTANFSNVTANGVGLGTYPGVDRIVMTDPAGGNATPSAFTGGTAFSVSYS